MKAIEQIDLLYAPESFISATPAMRQAVCNGCGPGGWKWDLVPDKVWGLDISPACDIHDWMYTEGATHAQKIEADRVFLYNMQRLVDNATPKGFLRTLRRWSVRKYYRAVSDFGGPYFWRGKNEPQNEIYAPAARVRA